MESPTSWFCTASVHEPGEHPAGEREAISLTDEKVRWVLPPEAGGGSDADSGAEESESDSGSTPPPPALPPSPAAARRRRPAAARSSAACAAARRPTPRFVGPASAVWFRALKCFRRFQGCNATGRAYGSVPRPLAEAPPALRLFAQPQVSRCCLMVLSSHVLSCLLSNRLHGNAAACLHGGAFFAGYLSMFPAA